MEKLRQLVVMDNSQKDQIFPLLRRVLAALVSNRGYSSKDLEQAKILASKIYVMHTNRKLSLDRDEFNLVVDLLQFTHDLEK